MPKVKQIDVVGIFYKYASKDTRLDPSVAPILVGEWQAGNRRTEPSDQEVRQPKWRPGSFSLAPSRSGAMNIR